VQSPSHTHRGVAGTLITLCMLCALCGGARGELIGHWKLDGNAQDATGANHGTVEGTNFDWINSAPSPDALRMNASGTKDSYVRVGDAPEFDFGTGDFTVSHWVKKLETSDSWSNTWGVGKWNTGGSPGSNEWLISPTDAGSDDRMSFVIESGTSAHKIRSPSDLPLHRWHHVVGVRRDAEMALYVNGELVDRLVIGSAAVNNAGRELLFNDSHMHSAPIRTRAVFDDVQIYNEALTDGGVAVGETASGSIGWLHDNPGVPTPEPSAAILLVLAAPFALSRRRVAA
jgi:hypothetical protein